MGNNWGNCFSTNSIDNEDIDIEVVRKPGRRIDAPSRLKTIKADSRENLLASC